MKVKAVTVRLTSISLIKSQEFHFSGVNTIRYDMIEEFNVD